MRGPRGLAAAAIAGSALLACTFPTVEYQAPCGVSATCADDARSCRDEAAVRRAECENACNKPAERPACLAACAASADEDRKGCLIECEGCALLEDCHNASSACDAAVGAL